MERDNETRPFAVVTGASSGIGYELAKQFAVKGYDVMVVAEDPGIHRAATELSAFDVHVEAVQIDLANFEGVEALHDRIQSFGRPLDAIAINAGVGVGGDFVKSTDLRAEIKLIELNVVSTVHLAKLVLKDMVSRGTGRVLFTSSVVSTMPGPFEAIYAASKAFVQSFSQALRNELKGTGVTVTSLMPGATETAFFHRAGLDNTKVGQAKKDDASTVAKQGFAALMAGKDHVVGGSLKNRIQVAVGKILPETLKAQIHRGMAEPLDDAKTPKVRQKSGVKTKAKRKRAA